MTVMLRDGHVAPTTGMLQEVLKKRRQLRAQLTMHLKQLETVALEPQVGLRLPASPPPRLPTSTFPPSLRPSLCPSPSPPRLRLRPASPPPPRIPAQLEQGSASHGWIRVRVRVRVRVWVRLATEIS